MLKAIFIFLLLSPKLYANCGTQGSVDQRLKNCSEEFDERFSLISEIDSQKFWYDHKLEIVWYDPKVISPNQGYYDDILSKCPRPYRLPKKSEILSLIESSSLPFKIRTNQIIIGNTRRHGIEEAGSIIKKKLLYFHYYIDIAKKKKLKNKFRKNTLKQFQLLCAGKLDNYFLIEGRH